MQTFEHSFHGFFSFLERFSSLDLQVDRVMKRSFPFVLLISTLLLPPRVEICCFMLPLIILTFLFSFRSKFIIDETMHFSSLFTNWFGVEGRTEHATMHLRAQSSARMNWLAICDVRKRFPSARLWFVFGVVGGFGLGVGGFEIVTKRLFCEGKKAFGKFWEWNSVEMEENSLRASLHIPPLLFEQASGKCWFEFSSGKFFLFSRNQRVVTSRSLWAPEIIKYSRNNQNVLWVRRVNSSPTLAIRAYCARDKSLNPSQQWISNLHSFSFGFWKEASDDLCST